jgi:hypothetical protein
MRNSENKEYKRTGKKRKAAPKTTRMRTQERRMQRET